MASTATERTVAFRVHPSTDIASLRRKLKGLVVGKGPDKVKGGETIQLRLGPALEDRRRSLWPHGVFI